MTPAEVNPDGMADRLRGLADAWLREAGSPVSLLADDPDYAGACLDVGLALERCAVDIEGRHARRRG